MLRKTKEGVRLDEKNRRQRPGLVLGRFASSGMLFNVVMLSIILWCADKLTWDCTFIDDKQDASGEGLLQGMGFDAETVERQAR